MKPLKERENLTPEERALMGETVYGPPVLTPEAIAAEMQRMAQMQHSDEDEITLRPNSTGRR